MSKPPMFKGTTDELRAKPLEQRNKYAVISLEVPDCDKNLR